MMIKSFYNQILTDHNLRPGNKHDLPEANYVLRGVNPSCGDDITLRLKVEDDPQNPTYITTVWGYGYKWGF